MRAEKFITESPEFIEAVNLRLEMDDMSSIAGELGYHVMSQILLITLYDGMVEATKSHLESLGGKILEAAIASLEL